MLNFFLYLPRRIVIKVIQGYQKTLSPDHSFWAKWVFPNGYCKFHPTCSEYLRLSFGKDGFLKGTFKRLRRLLRCNPWSSGGVDLP